MRRTTDRSLLVQNEGTITPPGIIPPPIQIEQPTPSSSLPERVDRNTFLIDTPAGKYTLALVGSRLAAALLDIFILWLLGLVLSNFSPLAGASAALSTIYFVALVALQGATLGMRAVGLKVIQTNGKRPDLSTAIVRHIIPFVMELFTVLWVSQLAPNSTTGNPTDSPFYPYAAFFTALWLLDIFWMTWDARKQTLHDKLARTYVVRRK